MPATAIAKSGQCLADIALQYCGSAEASWDIAALNGMSVTDSPAPGTALLLPPVVNAEVVAYYSANRHEPASWQDTTPPPPAAPLGIGFGIIGSTFIVA